MKSNACSTWREYERGFDFVKYRWACSSQERAARRRLSLLNAAAELIAEVGCQATNDSSLLSCRHRPRTAHEQARSCLRSDLWREQHPNGHEQTMLDFKAFLAGLFD